MAITRLNRLRPLAFVQGVGQWDAIGNAISTVASSPLGNVLLQLGSQVASAEITHALSPSPGGTQQPTQPVLPGAIPNAGTTYNVYVANPQGAGPAGSFSIGDWWSAQTNTTQIALVGGAGLLLYALLK